MGVIDRTDCIKFHAEVGHRIESLEAGIGKIESLALDVHSLKDWAKRQNGTLVQIFDKVASIQVDLGRLAQHSKDFETYFAGAEKPAPETKYTLLRRVLEKYNQAVLLIVGMLLYVLIVEGKVLSLLTKLF